MRFNAFATRMPLGTWRVRDRHLHTGSSRAIMQQLHRQELREAEEWNQARLVPFVVSSVSGKRNETLLALMAGR